MNNNYIEFTFNNNGTIKCAAYINGKWNIINNQDKCKILFSIAKNNYNFRDTGSAIIFGNANEIMRRYDKYIEKKSSVKNIKINEKKFKQLRRRRFATRCVLVGGSAIIIASAGIGASANSKNNVIEGNISIESSIDSLGNAADEIIDKIEHNEIINSNENLEEVVVIEDKYNDYEFVNVSNDTEYSVVDNVIESINIEGNIVDNNYEVQDEDVFVFSFDGDDLGERAEFRNAKEYEDVFIKYGNTYGIDPNLLMAIAAQEGSGIHHDYSVNGHALGIMQIEMAVWCNHDVSAYNFDTGEVEVITISKDKLGDVNYNIKVGAMIFQNSLVDYNYNIPLAIQGYNLGAGNINKVLSACSTDCGVSKDTMINDVTHTEWMNYRSFLGVGDDNYVEHVLENLEDQTELSVKKRDLTEVKIKIDNINLKNKTR